MKVSMVFRGKTISIKNMSKDIHASNGRVKTLIVFVLVTISHEDTWE